MLSLKAIGNSVLSALAIWGVLVFALMFNYGRLGLDPLSLPGLVFGSGLAAAIAGACYEIARSILAQKKAS